MLRFRRLKTMVWPGYGIRLLLPNSGCNCWSKTTKLAVQMLSTTNTTAAEPSYSTATGSLSVKGSAAARKLLPADEKQQKQPAGQSGELIGKLMEVQNQLEREQHQQKHQHTADLNNINTTNRRIESRLAKLEANVQQLLLKTGGQQQQRSSSSSMEEEENSAAGGKKLFVRLQLVRLCLNGTLVLVLWAFLFNWIYVEEEPNRQSLWDKLSMLPVSCKKVAEEWWKSSYTYTYNKKFNFTTKTCISNKVDNSLKMDAYADDKHCVQLLVLADGKSPNIGVANVPGNTLDNAEGKCSEELLISADGVTVVNRAVDNNAISRIRTKQPFTMPPPSFLSSAKDGNAVDHIIFYYEVRVNKNNGDIALSFTGPGELINNEPNASDGMPISDFFASLFLNIIFAGLVPIGGSTEPNKPKNNAQLMSNFAACTCTRKKRGDVLGCGLVLTKEATSAGKDGGITRRLFYTRNGKICCEPVRLPSSTDKVRQLYPTISLSGRSTSVEVNLLGSMTDGSNKKKPFRYDLAKHPGLDLEK